MSDSLVYGSIVVHALNTTQPFPQLVGGTEGQHAEGKFRGLWHHRLVGDTHTETEMALTQRNKYLKIATISPAGHLEANDQLTRVLPSLDSRFEDGTRHLYKLNMLMKETYTGRPYLAVINDVSRYGSISLLAEAMSLKVLGVYDTVNTSVHLVWTNDRHFENDLRATAPTRYVLYRFPVLENRPLFIHTQYLCSRWYDWMKAFRNTDGILRAFNVVETVLFRDPSVARHK